MTGMASVSSRLIRSMGDGSNVGKVGTHGCGKKPVPAKLSSTLLALILSIAGSGEVRAIESVDPYLEKFKPLKAPEVSGLFLKTGDRLAICGDSITWQTMYSRIMETYLTVCTPELEMTVRQYSRGGQHAAGFLSRMTNDCLRFKPTIATTCYGMNDHEYQAYQPWIGETYRTNSLAIIKAFKTHNVRVVQGSPGCVGPKAIWIKGSADESNLNLRELRNIGLEIAEQEKIRFADVFWPMLKADFFCRQRYGTNFLVAGKDGIHPSWAGQFVMAYAFLHALGLNGDLGTFTVNFTSGKANVSEGHELVSFKNGSLQIRSSRYPFCIGDGDPAKDDSIYSGTTLVPFNEELNRFTLVVEPGKSKSYAITWGTETKVFSSEKLASGINLAVEFRRINPFSSAFRDVDEAVAAKQMFERKQSHEIFPSPEAKADMESVVMKTERERSELVAAMRAAFVPVTHTIKIAPQ